MSGCYGNDAMDKYWERQLDNYLDDDGLEYEYEDEDDDDKARATHITGL